jgi:tetratricopeptide (TPR) repeat protein
MKTAFKFELCCFFTFITLAYSTLSTFADESAPLLEGQVDQYIYFAEQCDSEKPEIISAEEQITNWTETEKRVVVEALLCTYQENPRLILNVVNARKLTFARVKSSPNTFTKFASSAPGVILVNDGFFASPLRHHAIVHELVHLNDVGNEVAYSNLWNSSVSKLIAQLRLRAQFLTPDGSRWYDSFVMRNKIWTGLYGAMNLKEALAEFICFSIEHPNNILLDGGIKHAILNATLNPSKSELRLRDLITKGLIQSRCKAYPQALQTFQSAYACDSRSPLLQFHLAYCFEELGNVQNALQFGNLAEKTVRECDLPLQEPLVQDVMLLQARLLFKNHREAEAKSILDTVVRSNPYNTEALYWRSRCEFKMTQWGNYLNDFYQSRDYFFSSHKPIIEWNSDRTAAQILIHEFITSDEITSIKKAYFFLEVADNIVNDDERKKFLHLSLDALSRIREGENKLEALYMSFEISLRLNAISEADSFLNQIIKLDSEQVRIEIAKFRLKESRNENLTNGSQLISIPQLAQRIGKLTRTQPTIDSQFFRFIDSKSKLIENQKFLVPQSSNPIEKYCGSSK